MRADEAFACLWQAQRARRLAHGYVLVGDPHTAGAALATRVLQAIFCARPGEAGGCGACAACRHVDQRTHVDVHWLEPQMKSRQIPIEAVRELQQRMQQTSFIGGWKAAVFAGADRLTPAAANCFLKTLEEPPGDSLFLLLTDSPQALLPTIVSRCQTVALAAPPAAPSEWERAALDLLRAGRTGADAGSPLLGALAVSERLLGLLAQMQEAAEKEVAEAAKREAVETDDDVLAARASSLYRERRAGVMRTLLLWYRDRLVLASGGDPRHLHFPAEVEALRAQAAGLSRAAAMRQVGLVEQMHAQMERNLPERMAIGAGFPRLAAV